MCSSGYPCSPTACHPTCRQSTADYAAIPSHVYDRERDCGKCLKVRGTEEDAPGDWIIVKIVDGE